MEVVLVLVASATPEGLPGCSEDLLVMFSRVPKLHTQLVSVLFLPLRCLSSLLGWAEASTAQ